MPRPGWRDALLQLLVAGEPEQIVDPIGFAPGDRGLAGEAGIGPQDDPFMRPACPNLRDDPCLLHSTEPALASTFERRSFARGMKTR